MQRFLRYVVEHALGSAGKPLREYAIGVDVFDRDGGFDPRIDPIVRVEARRLRKKLDDYYRGEGADDALRIELPKGGYAVALTERPAPPAPRSARTARFWIVGAAAVILVGIIAERAVRPRIARDSLWAVATPRAAPAAGIQSIAVLPLQNLTGDPQKQYLVDGLTDAIVTDLAQLHALRVISRTSSARYKETAKSLPEIAHELHVDAIVEGSVVTSPTRVRITAQLIDARSDTHLWARSFEGTQQDAMTLQSQVAKAISEGVGAKVTPAEHARLSATYLTVPAAQDAYLKGRYLLIRRTPEDLKSSVGYFQSAIQADPLYARAYLGLAEARAVLVADDMAEPAEMVLAEQAVQRALALDDELGEAYATLGQLRFSYRWDFRDAEQQFRHAIELAPNDATAHQWYGLLLMAERRFDDASREITTALQIDPLSLVTGADLGQVHFYSGRFDQAVDQARQILQLNRDFPMGHDLLGMAYEQKGRFPEAIAAFERYSELTNAGVDARMHLAHVYAASGKQKEARELLRGMEAGLKAGEFRSPYDIASVYAGLGEQEQALAWLSEAVKERSPMLVFVDIDLLMAPLRQDVRFQKLVAAIGVPQAAARGDIPH
jgi:TolB-like protein/Flp pilus assembly protein TadD